MRLKTFIWGIVFTLALAGAGAAEEEIGHTPPRLSLVSGQVSFWRPGAQEWVQAQVNTALAAGDELYAGPDGNFELQVGSRAFVRGAADSQLGLENQAPGFLQLKIAAGQAAFDLRSVVAGAVVEVDTPNAVFTFRDEGYYRIAVDNEQTTITTRRGGQADALAAGGTRINIGPNETVVLSSSSGAVVARQTAMPLDSWDQWNYDRTGRLLDVVSTSYVAPETYGVRDLDQYGTWRTVPTYGPVWRPSGVSSGWVPYSTGSWMRDPYYGWTWVDSAPWGWAPYHYGRWVHVNGYWCWAPGPRVLRPVYAPALVAFFGSPGVSVGVSLGSSAVGWVSLGWGEPLLPWWGRSGFINRPWWGGWGGPRHINGRAVPSGTVVHVNQINHYHNTRVTNSMVVVDRNHFGRGPVRREPIRHSASQSLRPLNAAPLIAARPESYVPNSRPGLRPPAKNMQRKVVRTSVTTQNRTPALAAPLHNRPPEKTQAGSLPAQRRGRPDGLRPEKNQENRFGRQSQTHVPGRDNDEKNRFGAQKPAPPQVKPFGRAVAPDNRTGGTIPARPKFESPGMPRKPEVPHAPRVGGTGGKLPVAGSGSQEARPSRIERKEPAKPSAPSGRPAGGVVRSPRTIVAPEGNGAKGFDTRRSGPGGNSAPRIVRPESPINRSPDGIQRSAPVKVDERSPRPQGIDQPRIAPGSERSAPTGGKPGEAHGVGQHGQGARGRQPGGDWPERSGRGRLQGR